MFRGNTEKRSKVRFSELKGEWSPLPAAGSDRRYSRYTGSDSIPVPVVMAESEDIAENRAFISLAKVFGSHGIGVPEIYETADDKTRYWLEDLGDEPLFSLVGTPDFEHYAVMALRELVKLQTLPRDCWKDHVMTPPFSARQIRYDLNYFKYSLLKPSGVVFDEERLEDDFDKFTDKLLSVSDECLGFMYRDFQSRNVMIKDKRPRFIDFQGGRLGPVLYDAISFIWQAKANLPADMKERLLGEYVKEYNRVTGVSVNELLRQLHELLMFRSLQVLGAYGMRGLTQRRAHFLRSLPSGIANLRELLEKGWMAEYPELQKACRALCGLERFRLPDIKNGRLTVSVFSFSYKKGYPDDFTGNGGGFMFDCRSLHNPGRYSEYARLTGRDESVIRFLEQYDEVDTFLNNVMNPIAPAVRRYAERSFTSLQIGFGCTGGQHRSVYCAEQTAKRLHKMFPGLRIVLSHREQGIYTVYGEEQRRAFVLAAGLGTRLRPWTLSHPKALVPVGDRPMLERVLERISESGFSSVVVNVHHFSGQIIEWLEKAKLPLRVSVSDESDSLLDTGGAILKASGLLFGDGCENVLVHNADILSNADLQALYERQIREGNDITLLVSKRESSRCLYFDKNGLLEGWENLTTGERKPEDYNPDNSSRRFAFSGIYVIGAKVIDRMRETGMNGAFPIMDFMLDNVGNLKIGSMVVPDLRLIDIGKPETLAQANSLYRD